jgi:hypothetical protein
MKISLDFKDDAMPGSIKVEASVELSLDLKRAELVLRSLQAHDIPAAIAKAWSEASMEVKQEGEANGGEAG